MKSDKPLMPYAIRYFDKGINLEIRIPVRTKKACVSDGIAAIRQGHENVVALVWTENDIWVSDADMNRQIVQATHMKGDLDAYIALSALSALALDMARQAKLGKVSLERKIELLEAMEKVDDVLGLTYSGGSTK